MLTYELSSSKTSVIMRTFSRQDLETVKCSESNLEDLKFKIFIKISSIQHALQTYKVYIATEVYTIYVSFVCLHFQGSHVTSVRHTV